MQDLAQSERMDVVVIGGGQAGLAVGHELAGRSLSSAILDAHDRIGDAWRRRWDGLRVFTPARYDGLPGMRFPAPSGYHPTKDEVADFLESYAGAMRLPVRTNMRVSSLTRAEGDGRFVVSTSEARFLADQVVIATGAYHAAKVPRFASELNHEISQLAAIDYRDPSQLLPGPVLVVGASNSGAEIAMSAARDHQVILVGRDTGKMPVRPESRLARVIDPPFWFFISRMLRRDTRLGRKALPFVRDHGGPLERIWPEDLAAAGIERIPLRIEGAQGGRPRLADGRTLDVANVIWCTGFRPSFGWIKLPIPMDADGWPIHRRGVVAEVPGLYFVGLPFLYTAASALIGGVGQDAAHLGRQIERHARTRRSASQAEVARGAVPVS
jgi:putative flavoprotein involved in K+ transport